ncbi:MAG: VWA domain-containing protein [Pirellulales bacterium]|nr:VWA domain-containing protein [Pirellulales bacterium]
MAARTFCLGMSLLGLFSTVLHAQGVLVVVDPERSVRLPRPIIIYPPYPHPRPAPPPPPPMAYKIKDLDVQVRLVDQVARVQLSQTFANPGSQPMEVAFVFPLPYDGAIEQMTLLVDGKELPARLLDAKEARRMYEEIVRKNRDPALLEWLGTGLFKTSVFPVPPGASRTVSLRYSQICRKQEGLTDFLLPLSTAKYTSTPVEKVGVRVTIQSQEEIKNLYSPTHAVEIKRPDGKHAVVSYTAKNTLPGSDFRLFYDVGRGKLSAKVLSYRPSSEDEGFFLLLASPQISPLPVGEGQGVRAAAQANSPHPNPLPKGEGTPAAKTVLFVIDRSGSMTGKKIEQVKAALKYVLNNLRPGDTFNIVAYDSAVESFRPELQKYDEETRKAALGFVEGLYAGGMTDIDAALRTALGQLKDDKRPAYVVFLTDGLPTAGVTNEMKIVANAKEANKVHARIFTFGVGYDLNSRLLDKLVRENFGQSEFVKPDEDIEAAVSRLYRRIESPVLTDVRLQFLFDEVKTEEGNPVDRVYPRGSFDLFSGEQLVLVGRYKKTGAAKVIVTGRIGDREQKFDFPAEFAEKSPDESFAFVEKLWAVRRVGEILDEIDLKGKNDELIKELVELSTRHGILTPYTSFMADENVSIHDLAANSRRAGERLGSLSLSGGQAGVAQRAYKGSLKRMTQAPSGYGYGGSAPAAEEAVRGMAMASPAPSMAPAGSSPYRMPAAAAYAPQAANELANARQNVRQVGNRTFYQRNHQWIDSLVTKEQGKNARKIKQFSPEYFELANRHGRTLSQYLVFDEPVLLNLDNEAYLIEP